MRPMPLRALLLSLLLAAAAPAFAAYKCEANGKTLYSDTPCTAGKTIELEEKVTVTAADRALAQERLAKDKASVARQKKERLKREAAEKKLAQAAAKKTAAKQAKCATLAQRVKWSEEDAEQATGKSIPKAKKKARRMNEKYTLQCGT